MPYLILGLVLFLGIHSVRIFAAPWRDRQVARMGLGPWKGVYSVVSIVGFVVLVWGYGVARRDPTVIWSPPTALRQSNALFTLVAFIFFAAAYVPHNAIKQRFGHPMLLSVKIWAVGHLLANGTLDDIVLFGAFLLWAVAAFVMNKRRDRAAGVVYPQATPRGTAITIVVGVFAWALFAFYLHGVLIGVNPFG